MRIRAYDTFTAESRSGRTCRLLYNAAAAYIGPRVGAQSSARERLRAYIEAHIEYISQHLTQMMALAEIGLNMRNADGRPPLAGLTDQPALDPLIRLLRRGQEANEFRNFDARVVAITIRRAIGPRGC